MSPQREASLTTGDRNWRNIALAVVCGVLMLGFTACDDNQPSVDFAGPPPDSVPEGARPIATIEFGDPTASDDNAGDGLVAMRCNEDVLVLATPQREVHAELPCERMPSEEIIEAYLEGPAKITLVPADSTGGCVSSEACGKLFVQSESVGRLEFTVGRAWIVER